MCPLCHLIPGKCPLGNCPILPLSSLIILNCLYSNIYIKGVCSSQAGLQFTPPNVVVVTLTSEQAQADRVGPLQTRHVANVNGGS